jgi:protein-tyrosine phosphatase
VHWITDQVAIGNYVDAQDRALLKDAGIRSVLGLTSALEGAQPSALGLQRIEIIPLEDGPGNDPRLLKSAIDILENLVANSGPVLVHCHAGRSRSVVVVAAYLMRTLGLDAEAALAQVASKKEIAITPGLERLLDAVS